MKIMAKKVILLKTKINPRLFLLAVTTTITIIALMLQPVWDITPVIILEAAVGVVRQVEEDTR